MAIFGELDLSEYHPRHEIDYEAMKRLSQPGVTPPQVVSEMTDALHQLLYETRDGAAYEAALDAETTLDTAAAEANAPISQPTPEAPNDGDAV